MTGHVIPNFDLAGKTAVVTGGGSGLGAASAVALAAYGAQVAVLDNRVEAAEQMANQAGKLARGYQCDVSDENHVNDCITQVREYMGPIDVLINSAGVHLGQKEGDTRAGDVRTDIWRNVLSVNLDGTFFVTRAVIDDMVQKGGGAIVNISSLGGGVLGSEYAAYASSKGGIVGFTRSLVIGYSGSGIRANVICPGFVATPMTNEGLKNPENLARYVESIPVGRGGIPADIGGMIVFLASDASTYVNGSLLTLDGGTSLL